MPLSSVECASLSSNFFRPPTLRFVSRPITGSIKHYPWGDTQFIPELLGVEPDGQPWAELWLGTHPAGPAVFSDGSPLSGSTGSLPYLLKVLSAAEPLSLQAHPNAAQARDGFRRGVFGDDRAKPELLVALTPFEALCGVSPTAEAESLLRELGLDHVADDLVERGPGALIADLSRRVIDAAEIVGACAGRHTPRAVLVTDLDRRYPGEPSVAITLLLNHVLLAPGDALHLTAGNLHAYLRGSGIELMGASDNVVRAGLTKKPVDVPELLRVMDPTPLAEPVMRNASTGRYPLSEVGCELRRIAPGDTHHSRGHELSIALDGSAAYLAPGTPFTPEATAFVVTSG